MAHLLLILFTDFSLASNRKWVATARAVVPMHQTCSEMARVQSRPLDSAEALNELATPRRPDRVLALFAALSKGSPWVAPTTSTHALLQSLNTFGELAPTSESVRPQQTNSGPSISTPLSMTCTPPVSRFGYAARMAAGCNP